MARLGLALGRPRFAGLAALATLAGSVVVLVGPAAAAVTADDRELKAREAFAAGRYQDALEIFARLFAETLHPTYLRNVGRCHQMLRNPDKAIDSFREYLRRVPELAADKRAEVEGFIAEMEALKQSRAAAARASGPAAADRRAGAPPATAATRSAVPAPIRAPAAEAGVGATVVAIDRSAAEPELDRGHRHQLGVMLRGDTAVLPEAGVVAAVGLSFGLADRFEIAGGGLIGHFRGGWLGARLLPGGDAWKVVISLDLPAFVAAGKLVAGVQPGVGVQWDPSRHFGAFAELTASLFPGADPDQRRFWLVPVAGVQARF